MDTLVRAAFGLSDGLRLRLVLVGIADGIVDEQGGPLECVTTRGARQGAQRLLERIVRDRRLPETGACRCEVGDPAISLARLAHRCIRTDLLDELRAASPCPVPLVPPAQ